MKEELTKSLLKKSKIETSNDFTNTLINKIEAEVKLKGAKKQLFSKVLSYSLATILIICIILPLFIRSINLEDLKTPIFIFSSSILLLGFSYILKLKEVEKLLQ